MNRKSQGKSGKKSHAAKLNSPGMQILENTASKATHVPLRMEIFLVWSMGKYGKNWENLNRNPLVLIVYHFFKGIFSAFAAFGWETSPQNPVFPSETSQHHQKKPRFSQNGGPLPKNNPFRMMFGIPMFFFVLKQHTCKVYSVYIYNINAYSIDI